MCTYHNSEERYEKDEYFAKRKNRFFFVRGTTSAGRVFFKLRQIEQHVVHGGRKLVPKRTKRDKSDRGRRLYYNNMYSSSPYRR